VHAREWCWRHDFWASVVPVPERMDSLVMSRVRRTAKGRVGQEVAEGSRSDQEALGKVGRVLDATGQYIESEQSGKKTTILPALIQVIEYGWQLGFSSVLNIYRWMATSPRRPHADQIVQRITSPAVSSRSTHCPLIRRTEWPARSLAHSIPVSGMPLRDLNREDSPTR